MRRVLSLLAVMLVNCAVDEEQVARDSHAVTPSNSSALSLQGPTNQWTWFDVPGTICGNNQPTGVGVSVGTGTQLVIMLEGGGACWDEISCNVGGTGIAANIHNGYGATDLQNATSYLEHVAIFDRTAANNPYKDATQIYIPYCTGDFHIGDATQWWPNAQKWMHYAGRTNLEADLAQVVSTFPNPSRVTLAGMSAGAIGSQIYYWRVRQLFGGNKRVDLIADSAPMGYVATGRVGWNASAAFPPNCATCSSDYRQIYPYYATTYPDARFAFLSYSSDPVMGTAPFADPAHFTTTADLEQNNLRPLANTRYFTPGGGPTSHTMLKDGVGVTAGALSLGDFLTTMESDSPTWSNKTPNGVTCPAAAGNAWGAAEAKYLQLGGCGSILGAPTTGELIPPDLVGRCVQFQYGSIYWHPSTGTHEVHGAIREYWKNAGWERSSYGYPATDQLQTTVGDAVKNVFVSGAIYSSSATGTHGVSGAIWNRYVSLNAETGALGLPIGDESPTGPLNLDRMQRFQKGYIYRTGITGVTSVKLY